MKRRTKNVTDAHKSPRNHKVSFLLNAEERSAVERHLERYGIANKSSWYRSIILTHVLKMMDEDYPTLFNENEMRR